MKILIPNRVIDVKCSNIRLQIGLLNLANPNQGLWIFDQTQIEL